MPPYSILKQSGDSDDDTCPLEPFVVNVPDNISRVDIDQYLEDVQIQRRKGLNYSYNTDEEETDEQETTKIESPKHLPKKNEPWNEVS